MSSENNKNNFHEIITHWKITRKILYHWCQQFKFIYTVDFTLHFTLHLKNIFFMHLFKCLIFLVLFCHTIFISFFIYPSPFPLLLYMATLTVVHQTYTEEGMLLLPMSLWVWGTDSEKHPLLHFLTKPSQCHQPQDHEGHQQIPANPNPPSQQQSLSSEN